MANHLLESSAFVKYYQLEAGSDQVIALMDDPTNRNFISWLTLIEVHSALARRVRMGELTDSEFKRMRAHLYAQLRLGRIRVVWWSRNHQWIAIRLLVKYGPTYPLRALDAIQLAVALDLRSQGLLDRLISADADLCVVARMEGLSVLNPEAP
ncbi:MAG TPA: type II toxin-antitoxin system VapC family toxin [Thermoflexus sp.]|nr:type II toxin-antitoxin system VapC family toxin [Thermoflexus sp.]